jgi:hypothetical membrane protein
MSTNETQTRASTKRNSTTTNWSSLGAIAGPIVLAVGWIILGALHQGYSPTRQLISVLGIVKDGLALDVVFILSGLFILMGISGIVRSMRTEISIKARRTIVILLALSPLGLIWDGIFNMNHLILHTIGTQFACALPIITLPIIGIMLRRSEWRRISNWLIFSGLLSLVFLIGFSATIPFSELDTIQGATRGGGNLGLWERALITEVQAWYLILGWMAFRRSRQARSSR